MKAPAELLFEIFLNCDVITEGKEKNLYTAITKTRRNHNEKIAFLFLLLFFLTGCAVSNEQENSFRQISMDDAVSMMEEESGDIILLILVYCRSGNRSKQASGKLAELGYTNIVEIGGINDWTGDTVSEK